MKWRILVPAVASYRDSQEFVFSPLSEMIINSERPTQAER
jgi:hypothetical protein